MLYLEQKELLFRAVRVLYKSNLYGINASDHFPLSYILQLQKLSNFQTSILRELVINLVILEGDQLHVELFLVSHNIAPLLELGDLLERLIRVEVLNWRQNLPVLNALWV